MTGDLVSAPNRIIEKALPPLTKKMRIPPSEVAEAAAVREMEDFRMNAKTHFAGSFVTSLCKSSIVYFVLKSSIYKDGCKFLSILTIVRLEFFCRWLVAWKYIYVKWKTAVDISKFWKTLTWVSLSGWLRTYYSINNTHINCFSKYWATDNW